MSILESLHTEKQRKIIHIDMDCFYAAVELKHNPELRSKPIAVGGAASERSVLCTANYEARKFGVHSAMPTATALRLCPDLVVISPDFSLYKEESEAVRSIFKRFTDKIEPLSLDEAYLDVTEAEYSSGSATLAASEIRRLIHKERGLTASAGVAPNKFLAKVASDWNKPNGQFVIRPEDIAAFMAQLSVSKIYGVGKVTESKLLRLGVATCVQLQQIAMRQLKEHFGQSRSVELHNLARGIDDRLVKSVRHRKSLSIERTFSQDLSTSQQCLDLLPSLYLEWLKRLDKGEFMDRDRGALVKVKYFDFQSTTHEKSLCYFPMETDFVDLFKEIWTKRSAPVRLLGLGSRLDSSQENSNEIPYQLKLGI